MNPANFHLNLTMANYVPLKKKKKSFRQPKWRQVKKNKDIYCNCRTLVKHFRTYWLLCYHIEKMSYKFRRITLCTGIISKDFIIVRTG